MEDNNEFTDLDVLKNENNKDSVGYKAGVIKTCLTLSASVSKGLAFVHRQAFNNNI